MPAGNKRSYKLKKNLQLKTAGLFKFVCSMLSSSIKELKIFGKYVRSQFPFLEPQKHLIWNSLRY